MQFFTSQPIEAAATATLVALTFLSFVSFFFSIRLAFRSFIFLTIVLSMTLITYWVESYKTAKLRENLIRPTLDRFVRADIEDGLTVTSLSWNGKTLTHIYTAARPELIPDQATAKLQTCAGSVRVGLLALGGIIEHRFEVGGMPTVKYSFTVRGCFTNG